MCLMLSGLALNAEEVTQVAYVDCSNLTEDEQNFAQQMSPANQMMFCQKFNQKQRSKAMDMAGTMDNNGKMMTADMAVQKVAKDNNMMMPMKPNGQMNDQGMGDCSKMSTDEKNFSQQLNASNRRMFCGKFTQRQRQMAMDMAGREDENGNMMSEDEAVETIARDMNLNNGQRQERRGGGCSVN